MNKHHPLQFGLLVFAGVLIWALFAGLLIERLLGDIGWLPFYLINKGLLVAWLLVVMAKFGGLRFYGMKRGSSWWFLVPAIPVFLLTVLVLGNPEAPYGLSFSAAIGWIIVCFLVGISEESVFRGVLWRAFESRGAVFTAVVTSLMFGAIHLVGLFADMPWEISVAQAFFAFGMGMMFAAVRHVSGSLLAPIVLHSVFDAGAFLAAGGVDELLNEALTVEQLVIPGAMFALWGFACILIVNWRRSKSLATKAPSKSIEGLSDSCV